MGKHVSRRAVLQFGSIAGLGALTACDSVEFPGFDSAGTDTPAAPAGTHPPATPTPAPTPTVQPASTRPSATTAAGFRYEVIRTDADWRARLSAEEYEVLREGGTEPKHSSPLVTESRTGTYACKGCGLPIYSSAQKVSLDIGWVFFKHSYENSILTGIDQGAIESHCRRCGSHHGHILDVEGDILHCINGSALVFTPA